MVRFSSIGTWRMTGAALLAVSLTFALLPMSALRADDDNDKGKFQVVPFVFDPADTDLVQWTWLSGIGCPTAANVATYPATKPSGTYTDPGCPTGDNKDIDVEGLLLAKIGPTSNNASAGAKLEGLSKKLVLTE